MRSPSIRLSLLPLLLGLILSPFTLDPNLDSALILGESAMARSTGGRSGGGSFRRAPSAPRIQPRSPSGGSDFGSPRPSSPFSAPRRSTGGGGPIFIPIPTQPQNRSYDPNFNPNVQPPNSSQSPRPVQSSNAANSVMMTMLVLLIGGGGIGLLLWFFLKSRGSASPLDEINNDTVTVSKIQVALVANAGGLQRDLTQIAAQADTSSNEGLLHHLQEAALLLLRHTESWTHVYAESQTVPNLDIAQKVFNQMSIGERKKLSVETLVNVGGRVTQQQMPEVSDDEGPAAYIVVTLLVGTAHDHPLFEEIRDEVVLEQTLNDIASLSSDYLCVLELLWSPQDASDSLTYDELLSEYSELKQL